MADLFDDPFGFDPKNSYAFAAVDVAPSELAAGWRRLELLEEQQAALLEEEELARLEAEAAEAAAAEEARRAAEEEERRAREEEAASASVTSMDSRPPTPPPRLRQASCPPSPPWRPC